MHETVHMAEDECHQEPRVQIDTTLPFRSVRAAVRLFDEKAEVKIFRLPEKHGIKGLKRNQLQEELANVKRLLRETQDAKAKAFAELLNSKKVLAGMKKGMGKPCSSVSSKRQERNADPLERVKQNNLHDKTQHGGMWQFELKAAQQQHMTTMAELATATRNLEKIQRELVCLLNGRDTTLEQTEKAIITAEINARRVEELSNEILGTKESLMLAKLACMEVRKESADLSELRGGADCMVTAQTTTLWEQDIQDLEIKLAVATEELMQLRQELAAAQEAEAKVARNAYQAFTKLEHAKSILEKTQVLECNAGTSATAFFSNLDIAKRELEKALENGASLKATMNDLQSELDNMGQELASLREREENACAAVETLTRELWRTKNELKATVLAEVNANEVSQNLQQPMLEADPTKDNAQTLKNQAGTAKANVDRVRALMTSAQHRLEMALRGAEMAKTNESVALQRFKDLFDKVSEARAVGIETKIVTTDFQEKSMKKDLQHVENLANEGFGVQVIESMKANELNGQELHEIHIDCNASHSDGEEVETISVESETRSREGELSHRSWVADREGVLVTTQKEYHRLEVGGDAQPVESLAHFMFHKAAVQKKKKHHHLLPSLNSFLGRKNQTAINFLKG